MLHHGMIDILRYHHLIGFAMPRFTIALVFALLPALLHAQDSVDVTFRYTPAGNPSLVHVPANSITGPTTQAV